MPSYSKTPVFFKYLAKLLVIVIIICYKKTKTEKKQVEIKNTKTKGNYRTIVAKIAKIIGKRQNNARNIKKENY